MGLSMRIEGLDTEDNIIELYEESLVSTEYLHNTIGNAMARTGDTGYVLRIVGRIEPSLKSEQRTTQKSILELTKWAYLPYAPEADFYRKVSIVYEKGEQIVRELNFTKAYVLNYEENYDNYSGTGSFHLTLGQKRGEQGKINFGEQEQADAAKVFTPLLPNAFPPKPPAYYDLLKIRIPEPVDATSGAAPTRKELIEALFIKKIGTFSGMADHEKYLKEVIKRYMKGTPIAQEVFLKYVKDDSMKELTGVDDGSYYRDSKEKVFLNIGNDFTRKGTGVVFFHEYGHYIDHAAGDLSDDKTFRENLKKDFKNIMESRANAMYLSELDPKLIPILGNIKITLEDIMNPDNWNEKEKSSIDYKKLYEKISKELMPDSLSAVSDLYSGLSIVKVKKNTERIKGDWQHPVEYWTKNPDKIYIEALAHCYEAQFDPIRRANFRKYFPTAYERFEELLEGVHD